MLPQTPEFDPQHHVLGLLAGAGEYPRLVLQGARKVGARIVCAGFLGAVGREIPALCDSFASFRVGAVEAPAAFFRKQGVTHIMLAGQIRPAAIYTIRPDKTAHRLLATLKRRNAHTIFGAVCNYAHEQGWQILPSTAFMDDFLAREGHLAGPALSADLLCQARRGLRLARSVAALDIGQCIILRGQQVLCVEGFKGTNECINEAGADAEHPAMLCKTAKPGHDMRFDVPCIGADTARHCIRAHVRSIILEADRTLLLQKKELLNICNDAGISLYALPTLREQEEPMPTAVSLSPAVCTDDVGHAEALARALDALGIGRSAVVCEGVVIAVEDSAGLKKCVRRASAYMRRIRLMRLINYICRIVSGLRSSPPKPMVLGTLRSLTPEERRYARKKHVRSTASSRR